MNLKLHRAALRAGYCCLYALLWDTAYMRTGDLARALRVSTRCIRRRRREFRLGLIRCRRSVYDAALERQLVVRRSDWSVPFQCPDKAGATVDSAEDLAPPVCGRAPSPERSA